MVFFKFGPVGAEKPGVLWEGVQYDLSGLGDPAHVWQFDRETVLSSIPFLPKVKENERMGSPLRMPSKIVCVGLNYADHAQETGVELPTEPIIFMKASSAMCGPDDGLIIPRGSEKTDWEVELAVVIGKRASYVTEAEAMDYVAGYVLHNDYSERAFQMERSGQWVKGKSADTFAPMGPYLVTPDEIPDVHQLPLWLKVNGKLMQNSNTRNLVFKIPFLIHYISQFMSLLEGDVISTGTPPGVALGMVPPPYLRPGDIVELGIDGLGTQRQVCRL